MEKVRELLKGSFWKIDISKVRLSEVKLDFLTVFYDVSVDQVVDDVTGQERTFIVLQKKDKFINNSFVN